MSIFSSLGPLQSTLVASPPQQALPAAMPLSGSEVLKGAWVRIQLAMFGPYLAGRSAADASDGGGGG